MITNFESLSKTSLSFTQENLSKICQEVKKHLINHLYTKNFITESEYRKICNKM